MPLEGKVTRNDGNLKRPAVFRMYDPKGIAKKGTTVRLTGAVQLGDRTITVDTGDVSLTENFEMYELAKRAAAQLTQHPLLSAVPSRSSPTECHVYVSPHCGAERVYLESVDAR